MTALTSTATRVDARHVSFPGVLRSEWIKLWSLRSTYWTVVATIAAMVFIAVLVGATSRIDDDAVAAGFDGTMAIGMGYTFAQVVVAVLGVLTITGEYSTGMIRSTLAAVPRRWPALAAKAMVVAVVGAALGVVGVAAAYVASYPLLGGAGAADLTDPEVQRIFWGTALYLAGVGLYGLAVGAVVRHSAGAITLVLGVLLMLPSFWQLLMVASDWFARVYPYLPSVAGERIVSAAVEPGGPVDVLGPWAGFGVLMVYVVATIAAATALLQRRDA